ncbi:MAG: histidine kinase [Blastocatellia bacterium]|nr:MAG: histidine kinase [Blastocatellia bacterium]
MPKVFRLAVLILVVFQLSSLQRPVRITFVLTSPDLPDDTKVFITGGTEQLGMWDPGKVLMESKGNHTWSKQIQLAGPMSIEYKYTLGSWEREGADATGAPLKNLVADVKGDTTIKDNILFWTKGVRQKVVQGQITGTVKYHRAMKGEGLQNRDLIVWLPPDYDSNKTARYPVVYMHDGQNIIDPATSAFGVDWSIDETADRLIKEKAIPPLIVVGIYNTGDRMKEYVPGDKGTAYMNFIVKTVKPFIDSNYRTKSDRENTIVGGSSAGGIISFMLVWEHPDVFAKAICMSPAFKTPTSMGSGWNYAKVVRTAKEKPGNVFFYIDNGGVGLESQLQPGIDEMISSLKAKGYVEGKDFVFIHDVNAKHFEADWAKRFPEALTIVMKH